MVLQVMLVEHELRMMKDNLKEWIAPEQTPTPMLLLPAWSEIRHDPYGVVLIIAPFNFPFQVQYICLSHTTTTT